MKFDFNEKIVLVTGASRGIGREIATLYTESGATVIGTATSEHGIATIKENITKHAFVLNISDKQSIIDLHEQLKSQDLLPQILVNNAGITRDNLLMRMSDDEWNDVIQTNLNGLFFMVKSFIKPMIKARYGRIVNLTSVIGVTGNAGQINYASAKAGVIGFTKSLAQELGSRNITVNAVAPGFIETDMTSDLDDKTKESILAKIPLGRMGQAHDIAQAVAFLSSEQANYITGETLHVNGGMYMN